METVFRHPESVAGLHSPGIFPYGEGVFFHPEGRDRKRRWGRVSSASQGGDHVQLPCQGKNDSFIRKWEALAGNGRRVLKLSVQEERHLSHRKSFSGLG